MKKIPEDLFSESDHQEKINNVVDDWDKTMKTETDIKSSNKKVKQKLNEVEQELKSLDKRLSKLNKFEKEIKFLDKRLSKLKKYMVSKLGINN